jgi:hypothetical protein
MTTKAAYPELDQGDEFRCFDCGAEQIAVETREEMIAEAERESIAAMAAALGPPWEIVVICADCYRKRKARIL